MVAPIAFANEVKLITVFGYSTLNDFYLKLTQYPAKSNMRSFDELFVHIQVKVSLICWNNLKRANYTITQT